MMGLKAVLLHLVIFGSLDCHLQYSHEDTLFPANKSAKRQLLMWRNTRAICKNE